MIRINGLKASEIASLCYCDSRTSSSWIWRLRGRTSCPNDRPRSGRPPKTALKKIRKIAAGEAASQRQNAQKHHTLKVRVEYHMTNVRKIMHGLGMSAKTSQTVHVNRAEMEEIRE